ncbi:hypothetical protein GWK47_002362 [Chionoecetes opilio]|uniref:Uncharacterized protein n=1 Tax=Chionoecetes opilio TaxID=41210 RepID=A0A8J4XSG8_CHIOP|nr:hypothetical protein GWK47_002362 [Chionoecetes opilio]
MMLSLLEEGALPRFPGERAFRWSPHHLKEELKLLLILCEGSVELLDERNSSSAWSFTTARFRTIERTAGTPRPSATSPVADQEGLIQV